MGKKSINTKEVYRLIEIRLEESTPKTEILEELSEVYFDKKTIAKLIAMTPNAKIKGKYRLLNNILLVLLLFTITLKVLFGVLLLVNISIYATPLAFLFPFINIFFSFEVSKYRGYIYKALGLFAIVGVLNTLLYVNYSEFWGGIDIFLNIVIASIAFYLGFKMFPNYGFTGPKKNKNNGNNGNYVLE